MTWGSDQIRSDLILSRPSVRRSYRSLRHPRRASSVTRSSKILHKTPATIEGAFFCPEYFLTLKTRSPTGEQLNIAAIPIIPVLRYCCGYRVLPPRSLPPPDYGDNPPRPSWLLEGALRLPLLKQLLIFESAVTAHSRPRRVFTPTSRQRKLGAGLPRHNNPL